MPLLRIEPHDITIQVQVGATVLDAARAQGLFWPSTCGGKGQCTSCAMGVLAGHTNLSPITVKEQIQLASLATKRQHGSLRLACQAQVFGDVTVYKSVVVY